MGEMRVSEGVKSSQICATIIRADGTREELGCISYYHKNPFKRWWWAAKKWVVDKYNRCVVKK
jgi:hypothetical protein